MKKIALLLALVLLCACQKPLATLQGGQPGEPATPGGGLVVRQGDWLYYINGDNYTRTGNERFLPEWGALCRMARDGSNKQILVAEEVSAFYLESGTVYYVQEGTGTAYACRVSINGGQTQRLFKTDSLFAASEGRGAGVFGFAQGRLFFSDNGILYSYHLQTGKKTRLSETEAYNLVLSGSYAYFSQTLNGAFGYLYRVPLGGEQAQAEKISTEPAFALRFSNGSLYYQLVGNNYCLAYNEAADASELIALGGYLAYCFIPEEQMLAAAFTGEPGGIFVLPLAGGERTELSQKQADLLTYYGGYLYFVSISNLYTLWRVKLDGTGEERLYNYAVSTVFSLQVLDNRLYFVSDEDDGRLYSLDLSTLETRCDQYEDFTLDN